MARRKKAIRADTSADGEAHGYMRLSVATQDADGLTITLDVGPAELERLLGRCDSLCVLEMGRYGPNGWAHQTQEAVAVRALLDSNRSKLIPRDTLEGLRGRRKRAPR